jgi:hypothetical protein
MLNSMTMEMEPLHRQEQLKKRERDERFHKAGGKIWKDLFSAL